MEVSRLRCSIEIAGKSYVADTWLQVFRLMSRFLTDARYHRGSDLVIVVKGIGVIRRASAAKAPMAAADWRLICQPMRSRAARTRLALMAGHVLTLQWRRWHPRCSASVCDDSISSAITCRIEP